MILEQEDSHELLQKWLAGKDNTEQKTNNEKLAGKPNDIA